MFDEIIAPLYVTKWGRHLGWGAMISSIILLVIVCVLALYNWHNDFMLTRKLPPSTAHVANSDEAAKLIAQLPEQHIFGQALVNENVPITSLQLRLVGVVKADPEQYSRVIISEGGKPGKVYQIGDTLSGSGVKIHSITKDGVMLENGGQFEKLPLQRPALQFQGMPKPLLPNDKTPEE